MDVLIWVCADLLPGLNGAVKFDAQATAIPHAILLHGELGQRAS